jgi:O-antigen/teichoic acid export membrane protein
MLIRHTLAYLPAQLLGPLMQFATAIVLTHYLGAAKYGITMLIFASQELVFMICMSWWTFYMLRYAGTFGDGEARARYVSTERRVMFISTLSQIVATVIVVLIADAQASLALHVCACAFIITRSYLNYLAEYTRKTAAIMSYSLVQVLPPAGGLILTVAALVFLGPAPETVLLVFASMQLLVGVFVGRKLGVFRSQAPPDWSILKAAFKFGLPITLAGGATWMAAHGIRFVVQTGDGAIALGLLSVGWTLATRLSNVTAMVVTAAAYPLAVRAMEAGDPEGAKRQLSANSALLLGVVAPATLGVIAINEPLTRLLIAPEYHATTIAILPWALLGAAIRNLRMHGWDQMFLLFEAPKPMLVIEAIEAIITVLGAAIGLAYGGILGAVIATTVAAVLAATGDLIYLRHRFRMPVPFGQFVRILAGSGLMLGAIWSLPHFGVTVRAEWSSVLVTIALGMVVYAGAMMILFPEFLATARAYLRARQAGRAA